MDVPFNINGYVRVRLTAEGRLIHRRQHDAWRRKIPDLGRYRAPKKDADGYSRWQAWDLMATFGSHISHGAAPPFDTVIIIESSAATVTVN